MSFASDVKNEVARLDSEAKEGERAELFGLLRISGSVSLSGQKVGIHFTTENAALHAASFVCSKITLLFRPKSL